MGTRAMPRGGGDRPAGPAPPRPVALTHRGAPAPPPRVRPPVPSQRVAQRSGVPLEKVEENAVANTPLRRINTAQNFGRNVAWLASPQVPYITGQAIVVDGGTARSPL